MSWIEIRIKDIGKVITGNTPPTIKKEYFEGEYPFIKPSDLNDDEMYPPKTEMMLSEKGRTLLSKNLLPKHTPCVVTIGTIGKICFTAEPSFTNQQINAIIPDSDKYDNFFIYYLMKYHIPSVKVLNGGSASGRENVNKSSFSNIKVKVPTLAVQQKIASILSDYDELIENNKQRIQLLEEMASEIYKEWFVRLRFPGYENAVFKDKDGKVVDRESDGALPDGWTNGVIGDFVEFKKGKNITKNTVKEGNVPVVAGGLTPAYFHNKANTKSPTMTISASGANAGYVNLYYENIWASDCSYLDSTMSELFYYFYLTLKTRQKEVFYLQRGAAQPHVYPNDIMGLDLVFPDKNTVYDFEELIQPFMDEIGILQSKNQVLQETRDLLLPRLISGKLSVEHLLDETYEPKEAIRTAAEPTAVYETKSIK